MSIAKQVKRVKNKWKFNLKRGMMTLNGVEYVFNTAECAAEYGFKK